MVCFGGADVYPNLVIFVPSFLDHVYRQLAALNELSFQIRFIISAGNYLGQGRIMSGIEFV